MKNRKAMLDGYYRKHIIGLALADNEEQAEAERERVEKASFLDSLREDC